MLVALCETLPLLPFAPFSSVAAAQVHLPNVRDDVANDERGRVADRKGKPRLATDGVHQQGICQQEDNQRGLVEEGNAVRPVGEGAGEAEKGGKVIAPPTSGCARVRSHRKPTDVRGDA